ncbi:hypothetical protein J008_01981 [Cryptococcus neoformans]|nr:hypothetical protein C367_03943 [Cryptococcus neoformans var. grubii Ze90-1]OXH38071.1 hypothetical protein J008_01981 [Cryptococcus neoformans var. grubii]
MSNSSSVRNPLQRAHALSAQASSLLDSDQPSPQAMNQALQSYREAASLFEASAGDLDVDEGTKVTLKLLTTQHRKLARDLERRISIAAKGKMATPVNTRLAGIPPNRRHFSEGSPARGYLPDNKQVAGGMTSLRVDSTSQHLSHTREVPPFAYRPPPNPSGSQPNSASILSPSDAPSPLQSSSSSSEAPEESYVHFGAPPDITDPFNRFWAMLDNMLEDISNPIAFASAPLDTLSSATPQPKKPQEKGNSKSGKEKKRKEESPSPTDSFYLVHPKGKMTPEGSEDGDKPRGNPAPLAKTPEELALENTSLRHSLDTLASHTQSLEQTNRLLKIQLEERDKKFLAAMAGVKKEAARAKQGQELWRSQVMAGSIIPARAPRMDGSPISSVPGLKDGPGSDSTTLRKRIKELEEEVKTLKLESEKQKNHIEKYKGKFEKLKANARAKKEAKLAAAAAEATVQGQNSSTLT